LCYETWFTFSSYIIGQNSRIWSAENPSALHENPMISSKSALCPRRSILGVKFFEENGAGLDFQYRLYLHIVYDILGIFEK